MVLAEYNMAIYHRKKNENSQDVATARMQIKNSEIWGRCPHNYYQSDIPKVKAFLGRLPSGEEGIEFETDIAPDAGSPPGTTYWSGNRPGVITDGELAKLQGVKVIRVFYDGKEI
jgi:hypothetical protein